MRAQNFTISQSTTDGNYGVKNEKGEIVVPFKYASILPLPEGNFVVYESNPGWPMIINQKNEVLISKENYFGKALDAHNNHFICQYYKDGKMADLVLLKAKDSVVYKFPPQYLIAEFVKDPCYTFVRAQTATAGELLAVNMNGKIISGTNENQNFDFIKGTVKPCNDLAIVLKKQANGELNSGVHHLKTGKMILPCNFYDVEVDEKRNALKAYKKVYTSTYDLYDMKGTLIQTWEQINKK
jgi:hypothetical protein